MCNINLTTYKTQPQIHTQSHSNHVQLQNTTKLKSIQIKKCYIGCLKTAVSFNNFVVRW